ncbi:hypothetical protein HL667_16160 [Bradyrhizobium sp. 83012]|uniref:Sigma-like protein n=1 Tax=Bradyrhizobium aeschynomenes TaxID=2734909 RepID=A0ABX2CEA3_9BRAD|nr:hypothetical protein [Bradyrhizobium aeschynomenes]NPU66539.1 hypothetical protein [Bradyrhizobium aeschynomenes]
MSEQDRKTSDLNPGPAAGPRKMVGEAPKTPQAEDMPMAGPHARPELTDNDKTPGTGMLPEPGSSNPSPTG